MPRPCGGRGRDARALEGTVRPDNVLCAGHAVALGGTILMAPMDTPGFRSAVIGDPQGGFIAVSATAG
ncbi:hypothetical protein [Arthrobacter oryzae]|uniref:hypothetical protein n=1 Tax=Arthrobacter oryzae TaxID=409290 RepID=UPI0028620DC3|nr:hypothetical protein [Arthrobacter oryzae]MDR6507287.1 hypothetical protein [Arthrobacter oryzae]